MNETTKPIQGLNEVMRKGERLSHGFQLITPKTIAALSPPELHVVAEAISMVIKSRYGDAYGDKTINDIDALVQQIACGNLTQIPEKMKYYFWLVAKDNIPGFVSAISFRHPNEARLGRTVKSPSLLFKEFHGGQIMNKRIPFILQNLPFIDFFSVDTRATRVESVANNAKSSLLVPSGLEPIHFTELGVEEKRSVQDPSIPMIGLRNPKIIPHASLYAPSKSLSKLFMEKITNLMNAKWQSSIYNVVSTLTQNIQKNEIAEDDYSIRLGDYASVKILNPTGNLNQIGTIIKKLQEDIFVKGLKYLTFEVDPSNPDSILWQTALNNLGYLPTRFWPPTEKNGTPTLRFGKLNPQVTDVFSLNLPKVDKSFPCLAETESVFQMFSQIAKLLFAGKNMLPKVF